MTLSSVQWLAAVLAALLVGVSKTSIGGLGGLAVAIFAYVFPSSKQATGLVLPLFVFGDIVAVFAYRRHSQWQHLWRLFPWTALGVVLGYVALGRISDQHVRTLIGSIILVLAALGGWQRYGRSALVREPRVHWSGAVLIGVLAGIVTLIANAAGPLMAVYLVAMRLPKLEYMGTAAVFFLILNLFKVPFMVALGLISTASFTVNLMLLPAVLLGAAAGRWLIGRIDQRVFDSLALALSAVGGLLLLI